MPPLLGWTQVTLRRRTVAAEPDEYGNDVHTTETLTLNGCRAEPRASTENGNQVINGVWLYAPAATLIDANDEIEVNGIRYTVEGDPSVWRSFDGVSALQQVALKRVTG